MLKRKDLIISSKIRELQEGNFRDFFRNRLCYEAVSGKSYCIMNNHYMYNCTIIIIHYFYLFTKIHTIISINKVTKIVAVQFYLSLCTNKRACVFTCVLACVLACLYLCFVISILSRLWLIH